MKNKNAWLSALALAPVTISPCLGEEVIVTGHRNRMETAGPITVLTGDMIANSPINDINQIIQRTPGVRLSQFASDGTADITLRGLDPSNALVLVNGLGVTLDGTGLAPIPQHLVDRVEILRGPQGTMFGTSATQGAINVVTKPEYQAYDPFGSDLLNDFKVDLSSYWLAYDSKQECDETHGSHMPLWTFDPYAVYGKPYVSQDGDFWAWGDQEDGYEAPSLNLPMPAENHVPKLDYLDYLDLRDYGQYTYNEFNRLRARIRDYPGASELDKRDFIFGLFFGTMFSGFGSLSDDSVRFGNFGSDAVFNEFVDWSRTRTDEDRSMRDSALSSAKFYPYAGVEDIPAVPAAGTTAPPPAPAPAATPAATPAAASSSPAPMPNKPPPFDKYPYPPDYAFDFDQCDDELKDENGETQKDRVLRHIGEREQARANHSYYNDFLRSRWARSQDEQLINDALAQRDASNERLKAEWWNCTQGIATAPPLLTPLRPSTTTPAPSLTSGNWLSLKFHFEYADLGDGAPSGPVPGIAGSLSQYGIGSKLGLPFITGAYKDFEYKAGIGSGLEYSDDWGTMTFRNAIDGRRLSANKPNLGDDYDDDMKFDIGASYNFGSIKSKVGKNWSIYLDYDSGNRRGGASAGVRVPYVNYDSAYLEVIPGYLSGYESRGNNDIENRLIDMYGSDFLRFGGKDFYTFNYAEYGDFDIDSLDNFKGGTYWANNECGEKALPPESSGYLTASQSPVESVGDQWAFERVGLQGDEPSLDEFAKPVIIAVIDTGLDWHHLDFSWDNLWRNEREIPENGIDDDINGYVDDIIGWSFTDNHNHPWDNDGHGTAVAGIIAATQANNAGIDGINGNAKIMVLKALNNFGRTRATVVAKAIVYAADNGAQLINLSVTGPGFPKIVQDAVDYAGTKGVLVVNAAGNTAEDIDNVPGVLNNVLTVAATGTDDKRAIFSNYGNAVDVAAPGVDVVSLRARATDFMYNSADTSYVKEDAFLGEDRRYYRATGTSFATPVVTGIASLVLANNPGLKPAELKRVLEQSARDVEAPGFDRLTGFGLVDAKAALAADPAFFVYAGIGGVQRVSVDGREFIEAFGTADADQFESARLEFGQGESPENWTGVGSVLVEGTHGGSLGQIPVDSLAGGGTWTIRLIVKHANGSERESRYTIDL